MVEKGATKKVSQNKNQHAQNQDLSNNFLASKKRKEDVRYHPVEILKTLNQFLPYTHFKTYNI